MSAMTPYHDLPASLLAELADAGLDPRAVFDLVTLLALHDQQVLLRGDVDIARPEACDGERDAVVVLTPARDIERGIIVSGVQARLRKGDK